MKLSEAYLRLVPIHREWSKESHARDAQICINYFSEYSSFFPEENRCLEWHGHCKTLRIVIPHAS
eukprot:12244683-Prorocentrum_lima.AAC.1